MGWEQETEGCDGDCFTFSEDNKWESVCAVLEPARAGCAVMAEMQRCEGLVKLVTYMGCAERGSGR